MNLNDVFIVRSHRVPLKLVLGLMEDADSPEETKSWALSALFHASYTHDDSLRDYLYDALDRKGLHPYSEDRLEEGEQQEEKKSPEELQAAQAVFQSQLKTILDDLMQLKAEDGKPLFCQKNHWWAVYRIFVDRKIANMRENQYRAFVHLIDTLKLKQLNAELDLSTLSNITQDPIFRLPFKKWVKPWGESTRRINAYDRMHKIAEELLTSLIKAHLCKSL